MHPRSHVLAVSPINSDGAEWITTRRDNQQTKTGHETLPLIGSGLQGQLWGG